MDLNQVLMAFILFQEFQERSAHEMLMVASVLRVSLL
jgi:hypothetical protein